MVALHYLQEREWYDINLKLLQRIEAAKLTAKDFTHQEHSWLITTWNSDSELAKSVQILESVYFEVFYTLS